MSCSTPDDKYLQISRFSPYTLEDLADIYSRRGLAWWRDTHDAGGVIAEGYLPPHITAILEAFEKSTSDLSSAAHHRKQRIQELKAYRLLLSLLSMILLGLLIWRW